MFLWLFFNLNCLINFFKSLKKNPDFLCPLLVHRQANTVVLVQILPIIILSRIIPYEFWRKCSMDYSEYVIPFTSNVFGCRLIFGTELTHNLHPTYLMCFLKRPKRRAENSQTWSKIHINQLRENTNTDGSMMLHQLTSSCGWKAIVHKVFDLFSY